MFNFIKHQNKFLILSLVVVLVGIVSILLFGLKPGIDFTGGAIIEFKVPKCVQVVDDSNRESCKSVLESVFADKEVEIISMQNPTELSFIIKTKPIEQAQWESVRSELKSRYDDFEEIRFELVGPVLGAELLVKTMTALVITIVSLMIYIGWRFKNWQYGLSAILALFHDLIVIIGAFAIFGRFMGVEVDVMFVTAALTALAFSVHDTIVLLDRIRETLRRHPKDKFSDVANLAINATIVRSLSISLALAFVLVSMIVLGGGSIFWFVVALLIGTVSGAYSSPFLAVPLLTLWHQMRTRSK